MMPREWKQKNGHYHRSEKGGGQWEFFDLPNAMDDLLPGAYLPSQAVQF